MSEYLGIVQDNRFTILVPEADYCCSLKLTRISKPSPLSEDVVTSHEIDLSGYEGSAIMVRGDLPEERGWIYAAEVIDQSGPIITAMIKRMFWVEDEAAMTACKEAFSPYSEDYVPPYDIFQVAKEIDEWLVRLAMNLEEKEKYSDVRDVLKSRINLISVMTQADVWEED